MTHVTCGLTAMNRDQLRSRTQSSMGYLYLFLFCVTAFTELQTEIPDFSRDVGTSRVPFFDYRHYTFKVLFPDYKLDHPIMQMPTKNVRTTTISNLPETYQRSQINNETLYSDICIYTLRFFCKKVYDRTFVDIFNNSCPIFVIFRTVITV